MWENIQTVFEGPARLRFILQPLVAILLGLRDGRLDALAGRRPFVLGLFEPGAAWPRAVEALSQIALPLALAVALDAIVQWLVLKAVRPLEALLVGAALVALPYVVSRGASNRLARRLRRRRA